MLLILVINYIQLNLSRVYTRNTGNIENLLTNVNKKWEEFKASQGNMLGTDGAEMEEVEGGNKPNKSRQNKQQCQKRYTKRRNKKTYRKKTQKHLKIKRRRYTKRRK